MKVILNIHWMDLSSIIKYFRTISIRYKKCGEGPFLRFNFYQIAKLEN